MPIETDRTQGQVRRLRWMLRWAILIAAVVSIGGVMYLYHDLASTKGESGALNLVARQRMLSQRIAKNVMALAELPNDADAARVELREAMKDFAGVQTHLEQSGESFEFASGIDADDQEMVAHLRQHTDALLRIGAAALQWGPPPPEGRGVPPDLRENETVFVAEIDELIAHLHDNRAAIDVRRAQMAWLLAIIIAVTLGLEWLLLYEPAMRLLARRSGELIERRAAAEQALADLRTSERQTRLRHEVVKLASEPHSVETIIFHCLEAVCEITGWVVGHAYAVNGEGMLVSTRLWHLPQEEAARNAEESALAEFRRVSEAFQFAPGVGLPGRVLESGKPLWIADILKDENFPRAQQCTNLDLHGALGFPVITSGRVVAVLEFFSAAVMEPDSALIALAESLGRDIGRVVERQWAEQILAESERRTRLIIDNAFDPMVAMDDRGAVTDWNPQAQRTFGFTRQEAVGRPLHDLIIPERFRKAHVDGVARYLSTGESRIVGRRIEMLSVRKDGSEITVELAVTPIRTELHVSFSATLRDITERKQADAQRERANMAEAANRAKDEFLAHMSHEMRTPLNGIIGMTDLLLGTELSDQQRRYARLVKTSGESLTTIVSDVLDLSKIEAGKFEIECVDFDLHSAVEDVMDLLAQSASAKSLELACHIQPEIPRQVRGDPDRLRQVLVNLVNNAIKFTDSGMVIVHVAPDNLTEDHVTVRFSITDTGIGIPEDRMERLFKSFSQIDASTTRRFGGTGLGLAISKQLAELMGGRIGAESELGRGSTFWFTAALLRPTTDGERTPPMLVDPADLRVLAVDDNETVREILREQLVSWGLNAATASQGIEALGMLTEAVEAGSPFRVAIIDSDMPGMSGIELGQTIRSRADIGQTVLMIMATMDAQFNPAKLRELGFDGCMTKPVRQSQLFDAIMSAIANAAAMPQLLQVRSTAEGSSGAGRMRPVKRQDARILLAEDNEVNQIVAAEILAKAGYRYDIVADGRKAVEAVFAEHYDLVVMDCQMPELDGFEATHVIRERETIRPRGKGLSARIPIIALTANAIKGDRERCLAAGMDAYISKPVDPAKLIEAIDSLISGPGGVNSRQEDQTMMNRKQNVLSTPPAPAASRPNDPPPFDLNKLLGRCMNSVQTVELILKKFQEQAVQDIQTLTASVSSKDKERTSRTAHGLKGAAGILSATPLTELAAELERMGREDDLDQAEAFLARLEAEVERCLRHLPVAREALAQKSSGRSA